MTQTSESAGQIGTIKDDTDQKPVLLHQMQRITHLFSSTWLLCILIGVIALGFNLYRLGSPSIWYDEAFSVELARQPLPLLWHIIWGQEPSYLFKQMRNYRNGERDNPIMSPIAKSLAEEDLRKIASYFAAKSWPAQSAIATPAPPPKGIAQCQPCHQPNFQGGPPAPRLAGLSYEYLVTSMHSFAANERTNNGDMPKFMQMLTDSERDAIARYLSDL